jgi:hypothetical protein
MGLFYEHDIDEETGTIWDATITDAYGRVGAYRDETEAETKKRVKAERAAERKERQMFVKQFLSTLRKVPDDIVLSTAARELDLGDEQSCLCGTFMRECLVKMRDEEFSKVNVSNDAGLDVPASCAFLFGGEQEDWEDIFTGVIDENDAPLIEEAFMTRVFEAVNR